MKTVIPKIIIYLKSNKNFTYVNKTINNNDLLILSKQYKHVYVCMGANSPESIYNKNIGGYKIYIKSKIKPKCLSIENGFLINTENDLLVVRGGFIDGNKTDNQIKNIIQKLSLWNTYKCSEFVLITKGIRSVSLDNFPFYYLKQNISYIKGGSFIGCAVAPSLAYSVVNNEMYGVNPLKFNFHISRLNKNIQKIKNVSYVLVFLFLVKLLITPLN